MSNSFLKKIILEEIENVCSKQEVYQTPANKSYGSPDFSKKLSNVPKKKVVVADRKIKKLQKHLVSLGYNVGSIDGIAGPKLFSAIARASGIPMSQVAKDFRSSGPEAAVNFITALSGVTVSQDVSAKPKGVDNFPQSKPREMGRMRRIEEPKEGDRMKGELGTEVYHNGEWIPESEYLP